MARVLIVDDEEGYCELLGRDLSVDGHEIRTAFSGREALDVGTRYRPDVLVTDWMLKDDIHGLHVVHVLDAVLPDTRAILMTGFPSDGLRGEANKASVCDFIEKPFDSERIQAAVREAIVPEKDMPGQPLLAMVEIDAAGSIVFANLRAKEMMSETEAGRDAQTLADIFSAGTMPDLDAAMDRWVVVSPHADEHEYWRLRSQEPLEDGSRLIIIRRADEPHYLDSASIEMLLGIRDFEHSRWPFDERVLVVDDEAVIRTSSVSVLEAAGAGCYAVETPAEAIRLLENDEELRFVVLDFDLPHTETRATVEKIKSVRPDAMIVGNSGEDHRADFAAMGVEHFLQKPWRVDDLINILTGRIGNCVSCGLPIPLRRPRPNEAAGSWVCCNCGAGYRAVFDDDSPHAILSNVRPPDPI